MVRDPAQKMDHRRIIHVDMDAFYASVEQRDDPGLRGKPLAVGGSRERGVVAAASYEARRYGVRSAMPSVTARRQCPELIFVKPRFEVYREVSLQIRRIFADYTPLIQPLSLDEAYLDVSQPLRDLGSATAIAREIRCRIREQTGLTASAGVSYNKFLAKLASDHRKPDGLFVITPGMGPAFVEELRVSQFHGVGPVTAGRMQRLGIHTGRDLRARTQAFLTQHFGKAGPHYYAIARGQDDRPVLSDQPKEIDRRRADLRARHHGLGRRHRGDPAGDRQGLVHLRQQRPPRPHRHAQGEVLRLPADHPRLVLRQGNHRP